MLNKHFTILLLLPFLLCNCSKEKKDEVPKESGMKAEAPMKIDVAKTLASSKVGQRLLPQMKFQKAETALRDGKYSEALAAYDEMMKLEGLTAEARTQLNAGRAECLFQLKKFDESIVAWEQVISIRQNDPFPYHNMAIVMIEAGKTSDALKTLDKALKIEPDMLPARLDIIKLKKDAGTADKDLVEDAQAYDKSRTSLISRLTEGEKKNDESEISRILNIFSEIPEETPGDEIVGKLLAHKSPSIREKAGELAVRTPAGKKQLASLVAQEKDAGVKSAWEKYLAQGANPQ